MVRTQIQLSEEQSRLLKRLSAELDESVAELIRRAVEMFVGVNGPADPAETRRRARNAAGRFRSGKKDVSADHDKYLAGDFGR